MGNLNCSCCKTETFSTDVNTEDFTNANTDENLKKAKQKNDGKENKENESTAYLEANSVTHNNTILNVTNIQGTNRSLTNEESGREKETDSKNGKGKKKSGKGGKKGKKGGKDTENTSKISHSVNNEEKDLENAKVNFGSIDVDNTKEVTIINQFVPIILRLEDQLENDEMDKDLLTKFRLLNKGRDKLEEELFLAEQKKFIIEKLTCGFSLKNLHPKKHTNQKFLIEVLFSNTENPEDFFTIGNTKPYSPSRENDIFFHEGFEVNYLFQRTQFIKLIIYSSDGKKSSVTINLANVVFKKLEPCTVSVDLLLGQHIYYEKDIVEPNIPVLEINFKRTTQFLDKKLTSLFSEFNYHFASTKANRLRYELYVEDYNDQKTIAYKSNELFGKNPLVFSYAIFEHKKLFESENAKHYIFEIYEGDNLYGRVVLERSDMDEILKADQPIPFNVKKDNEMTKSSKSIVTRPITMESKMMLTPSRFGDRKNTSKSPRPDSKKLTSKLDFPRKDDKHMTMKTGVDLNKSVSSVKRATNESKNSTTKSLAEIKDVVYGQLYLSINEIKRKKFMDYILEGLEINFEVAIDYTSSNLDPKDPKSLHTFKIEKNEYARAIRACGNILKNYDTDQLFPVFGFGGVPKRGKEVSHCFNLNGKKDPSISGLENVIEAYKQSIKEVEFVGPTHFQDIIRYMVDFINKSKIKKGSSLVYHVFLILTDGKIDDMDETKHILVEASKLPMSIIIVGIGNGDFGKMNILDGDEVPIASPFTGEVRYRDIVQFVNFSDYENDGTKLAAAVLEEIPCQVEDYCRSLGI